LRTKTKTTLQDIWSQTGLLLRPTVSDDITDMDLNSKDRGEKRYSVNY